MRARSPWWSWVTLAVVLVAAVVLVDRNGAVIASTLRAIGWPAMVGAAGLALLGTIAVGAVWLSVLRELGGRQVPVADGGGTFFVTQLGKYLPGALWPILAQVAAAHRWGCRRSAVVAANLVMLGLLLVTGLLLALITLPWVPSLSADWLRWGFVLVPVLVVLLLPRTVPTLAERVSALSARWGAGLRLADARLSRAVLASLLTWALWGGQLWVLLSAAGGSGAWLPAVAIGASALAWSAGLLVVVAPAGAGVREAVLVAVCAPVVGAGPALAVALAARVLLTLADVALAVVGGVVLSATVRRGSASPRSVDPESTEVIEQ